MSKLISRYCGCKMTCTLPKTAVFNMLPRFNSAVTKVQNETSEEQVIGKNYTVKKLQQLLGISTYTALGIANSYKNLSLVSGRIMSKNYEVLKKAGVSDESLVNYPSILAADDIERKLVICRKFWKNVTEVVPLLDMKITELENMVSKNITAHRLKTLSELLQMSITEVCHALSKKSFLRTISIDKLKTNLKLLTDHGVSIEDIQRDLWVLCYNPEIIKNRLEMATQMRVEKIKTWMVRCKPEILDKYATRRVDKKEILGDNSLAEYLSEKLECSVEEAKLLINKHPALQNKSMKKMSEIFDFLFAQGFQPKHIYKIPKILLHSVETTKQRLKELEAYGKSLDSLYVLTKSKKQYMQYFESLVKSNKKTKKSN